MTKSCFNDLEERGFFYQLTDTEGIKNIMNNSNIKFYVGFDPTADSLHIGHLLPIMAARRLQQFGHTPIMLVGGATALVGDPSGKQEARPVLSKEKVAQNASSIKTQLDKFIDFDNENAIFVNNADWFSDMLYIDVLRDVGRYLSLNRMLSMESVKQRLGSNISFLEFNYMVLQAYDFVHLNKHYNCCLQIGGQDQWGNIVCGIDLVNRLQNKQVYGATFPLLTNRSNDEKFGKTAEGAVWLEKNKTSVFNYYQFWRNVDDRDVERLMLLFTGLPVDEIKYLSSLEPPKINRAKEILAYEATKLAHGEDEAKNAFLAAGSKFGFYDKENTITTSSKIKEISPESSKSDIPEVYVDKNQFQEGIWVVDLFYKSGLCTSKGEAKRLIKGGGAYLNGGRISDMNLHLSLEDLKNNELILKAGKKKIKKVVLHN